MATGYTVVEDVDALMRSGLVIRDANGEKIGSVKDYRSAAGYLVVVTGLITCKEFYVPYSAITSIDPSEIYLNHDKNALTRQYSAPPQATFVSDGRVTVTAVPSGRDSSLATLNRVDLDIVCRDLARGMTIYALYHEKVGTVDGIDAAAGYFVAKRHHFGKHLFFIPFAAIKSIDHDFPTPFGAPGPRVLYLAVARDVLVKEFSRLPDGIVLHNDDTAQPKVEEAD